MSTFEIHKDDIPWWETPIPWWIHRCTPWTRAAIDGVIYQRCACGAMTVQGSPWMGKNETRRQALRKRYADR